MLLTVMVCVVAAVDHKYPPVNSPASKVTEPPTQKVVGPFGVITIGSILVQPTAQQVSESNAPF